MKKLIGLALLLLLVLGVAGCFKKKDDHSKEAVCVVDNTSVRVDPSKKGQWLSSLALGETVQLMGEPIKDLSDPTLEYVKVKLSDGTEGFANTYGIVRGAYVSVVYNPCKIYKRPDLLADSSQKMDIMDLVAVEEENGNFIRVTGENRAKGGWIEKSAISKDKYDIVTAVLLKKALRGKKSLTEEEMEQIIAKLPYPDNDFVQKTREKYGLAGVSAEPDEYVEEDNTAVADESPVSEEPQSDSGNTEFEDYAD